jgi:hypothetical protein
MQCLAGAGERSREIPPIPKKYHMEFNDLVERNLGRAAWTAFRGFQGHFVSKGTSACLAGKTCILRGHADISSRYCVLAANAAVRQNALSAIPLAATL